MRRIHGIFLSPERFFMLFVKLFNLILTRRIHGIFLVLERFFMLFVKLFYLILMRRIHGIFLSPERFFMLFVKLFNSYLFRIVQGVFLGLECICSFLLLFLYYDLQIADLFVCLFDIRRNTIDCCSQCLGIFNK